MKWKVSKEGKRWESHELKGENLRMSIHHHMDHDPNEWILSCRVFGSMQITLENIDIEAAKVEAVAMVKARLRIMVKARFQTMLGSLD